MTTYFWEYRGTRLRPLTDDDVGAYLAADLDSEAKHLMLSYMFDERRFEKYDTQCLETNEAIIAHLNKLGCVEEGRRRRTVFTNGRFYDEILFGLTRDEWKAAGA